MADHRPAETKSPIDCKIGMAFDELGENLRQNDLLGEILRANAHDPALSRLEHSRARDRHRDADRHVQHDQRQHCGNADDRDDKRIHDRLPDGAPRRAEAYLEAGANVLFVEAPESEKEMARICQRFDAPLLANMAEATMTPLLPQARLEALGYQIAIFPGTPFFAAAEAVKRVYAHVAEHGSTHGVDVPLMDFGDWCRDTGFPAVWEFDAKYAD